jgi:hypothetical protein
MKFRDMREIRTTPLKDTVKYALVIAREILSDLKQVAAEESTSVNEILRVLAAKFLKQQKIAKNDGAK